MQTEGSITNSYATGPVSSFFDSNVGGLVGDNEDSNNINNSYWDTVTSQTSDSDGGTGQTTTVLTGPTDATGIYVNWDTNNWDFGTPNQYPAVKYARVDDTNPACRKPGEQSQQPACGTLLPGQKSAPPTITIPPPDPLPLGTTTTLIVVIEDVDSDSISVQLDSSNLTVATATIVAINDTNYTLELTGSSAGAAVITVTASDDEGSSAEEMFTILVDAKPTGMIEISPSEDDKWLLETTSTVVDANGIAETKYQWFKGDMRISEATTNTYMIMPDGRRGGTMYRLDVTIVDKIGQSATISSNVYTVENLAPMINRIIQRRVFEGGTVRFNPTVTDANGDIPTYEWRVISGDRTPSILELQDEPVKTDTRRISFTVPNNWIVNPSTATGVTETLRLEIKASDGSSSRTRVAEVVVTKINNGPSETSPRIERNESNEQQLALKTESDNQAIADDPDGDNSSPNKSYQWQRCQSSCSSPSSWTDIDGERGRTYIIPNNEPEDNRFRIKLRYTDGQGYPDNTIFTNTLAASATADIKIRAKVFLEGPLQ